MLCGAVQISSLVIFRNFEYPFHEFIRRRQPLINCRVYPYYPHQFSTHIL